MSKEEFFAFMPLLIYGIAVSELIMHWRDYLKADRRYWPHIITGLILLELGFVNFFYLYDTLDQWYLDYPHFLLRLSSPLLLLLTVSVYTPENDRNVKDYFNANSSILYTLLSLFIIINIITEPDINFINLIRFIAVLICALIALTKKYWLIWFWVIIRGSFFIIEEYLPQLIQ